MIPPDFAAHADLLLEPWCLTVGQVKRLTAWQAEHLYRRPTAAQAERMRREAGMGEGATDPAYGTDPACGYGPGWDWNKGPPPKDEFVAAMVSGSAQGIFAPKSADEWADVWEQMVAEHKQPSAGQAAKG